MRLTPLILAMFAFTTANGSTQLPQQVQNVLTTIDIVPTPVQLDAVYGGDHTQALTSLAAIAGDNGADRGIRLRAIHALSKYCASSPCGAAELAHTTLFDLINANSSSDDPYNRVVLRGAVEAIGPQRVATDRVMLEQLLLQHPSRDIRAATAHALRDLCNTQAIPALRTRQQEEPTAQVRLAITEALRVLGQPGC